MKTEQVFFYDRGGHCAGRQPLNTDNGKFHTVPADSPNNRYEEICKDPLGTLRSPYGRPELRELQSET